MAPMTQKWPFSPRFSPFSLDFLVVTATIMKTCHLFMVSLLINVLWIFAYLKIQSVFYILGAQKLIILSSVRLKNERGFVFS